MIARDHNRKDTSTKANAAKTIPTLAASFPSALLYTVGWPLESAILAMMNSKTRRKRNVCSNFPSEFLLLGAKGFNSDNDIHASRESNRKGPKADKFPRDGGPKAQPPYVYMISQTLTTPMPDPAIWLAGWPREWRSRSYSNHSIQFGIFVSNVPSALGCSPVASRLGDTAAPQEQ